jgi:hypothetical protein
MTSKTEVQDIFIDLDVVLDTRLALLYVINEELAVDEVNTGKYNKRYRDQFGNISANVFNMLYKQRNKILLKYALPSNMFKVVNELVIGHVTDSITTHMPKLYVNTYPYQLDEDEKTVVSGMIDGLFKNCTFELVYMDNIKDITPKWVRDNVQTIIKYDGLTWLENHSKLFNISSTPLLDKTLIVPAIVTGYISKNVKVDSKFFTTTAIGIKSLIKVLFTDVLYFNSIIKK